MQFPSETFTLGWLSFAGSMKMAGLHHAYKQEVKVLQ